MANKTNEITRMVKLVAKEKIVAALSFMPAFISSVITIIKVIGEHHHEDAS